MNNKALKLASRPDSSSTASAHVLHASYLFADSAPFSHNFDFISVLEGFVDLAAEVLSEARTIRDCEDAVARARGELAQNVVILHKLEGDVVERAVDLLFTHSNPAIERVAVRLDDVVRDLCGRSRGDLQAIFNAQASLLDTQVRACEARVNAAVKRFFLERDLKVNSERFSLFLTSDGYLARLRQVVEGEITARYEIAAEKTFWSAPRRVSDLVDGLRIGVGLRRKRFSRLMCLETRTLGDYLIGRVHSEGDSIEVALRRRLDEGDSLLIQLSCSKGRVMGRVLRPDASDAPFDVPPEHLDPLITLWRALAAVCVADKEARASIASVSMGERNLLHPRGAEALIDYLVTAYRPIVAELLDHGAALGELSLKRNLGDGRREERFVNLSHLIEKVSALGNEERARLRKLGLDGVAPRASEIPPEAPRAPRLLAALPENQNESRRGSRS